MNFIDKMLMYANNLYFVFPVSFLLGYSVNKIYGMIRLQIANITANSTLKSQSNEYYNDCFKLVLIVRNDLKMQKGKVAAQCAHAAVSSYKQATKYPKILEAWEDNGQTKITLKCDTEAELYKLSKAAKQAGLLTNIVCDAGQTQVAPGSRTVCAIGPGPANVINQITQHLKLY